MQQESLVSKFGSGLIYTLNTKYYRVLYINNEFYLVDEYEPPTDKNKFHYVRGRDITQMVMSYGSQTPDHNSVNSIIQNIFYKPIVEREYSNHFSFVIYSPIS